MALPAIGKHLKRRKLPAAVKRRRLLRLMRTCNLTARQVGEVIERHEVSVRKYRNGKMEIPAALLEYAEYRFLASP